MSSWGRNNIIGYCYTCNSKKDVKIEEILSYTFIKSSIYDTDRNINLAIGDSRGNSISVNCHSAGEFTFAMDGLLLEQEKIYQDILKNNKILLSKYTNELIVYLLAKEASSEKSFPNIIRKVLEKYPGGYSLMIMTKEKIYAARDCYGVKPLVIGRLEDSNEVSEINFENEQSQIKMKVPNVITSSSTILESIGAKYIRQILPGEVVELSAHGIKSFGICYRKSGDSSTMCAMEYVIMEPASSFLEEQQVHNVRFRLGQVMAVEKGVESDCVITIPNVSMSYILGYAEKSGLRMVEAFYYSTIEKKQLSLYYENVADKVVTLIIDSALNHDLSAALRLLKTSKVKKVHLRVCSPMIREQCPFGIKLTDHSINLEDLSSVSFIDVTSLSQTIRKNISGSEVKNIGHCFSCFGKKQSMQKI